MTSFSDNRISTTNLLRTLLHDLQFATQNWGQGKRMYQEKNRENRRGQNQNNKNNLHPCSTLFLIITKQLN